MLGFSSARTAVATHLRNKGASRRLGGLRRAHPTTSTLLVDPTATRRYKSTAAQESTDEAQPQTAGISRHLSVDNSELISFPVKAGDEQKPVLLNAQEHAVGYLSKILNARVYDAAKESELQHAKNLSAVRTV